MFHCENCGKEIKDKIRSLRDCSNDSREEYKKERGKLRGGLK